MTFHGLQKKLKILRSVTSVNIVLLREFLVFEFPHSDFLFSSCVFICGDHLCIYLEFSLFERLAILLQQQSCYIHLHLAVPQLSHLLNLLTFIQKGSQEEASNTSSIQQIRSREIQRKRRYLMKPCLHVHYTEQKHFDLQSLSPALRNLWLLLVQCH